MKKTIITTTIHSVLPAIKKYDLLEDWNLIVVGDVKTPEYILQRGTFISWEEQKSKYSDLCDIMGPNSVDRGRNIGFIEAYIQGADIIATIDDDNIPLCGWGESVVGKEINVTTFESSEQVFDPMSATNAPHLWHRGFPLDAISSRPTAYTIGEKKIIPLVQANLWLGDPDIDAICRLIYRPNLAKLETNFSLFTTNCFSPFNTQNTIIDRSVIKDYISIPFIGRMDDIWGAYLFEAKHPGTVVYGRPTVKQVRSPHDIINDMKLEWIGYQYTGEFIERLASGNIKYALELIPQKSVEAIEMYESYFK